jgi:hypothetical protein
MSAPRTFHADGSAPEGEWLPVPGYEGRYFVSSDGRVWSLLKGGRFRKTNTDGCGYHFMGLVSASGRMSQPKLHRLVASAFVPNPRGLPQVNHKDGNKDNNAASNLEWVTASENIRHAFAIGLSSQKGERNTAAKLTNEAVRTIRERVAAGDLQKDLAARFGVSRAVVCNVVKNKIWRHV